MKITYTIEHEGQVNIVEVKENNNLKEVHKNYSMYAMYFDKESPYWNNNSEMNKMFLISRQEYANDILRHRGHLFLNEVYDILGLPRSSAGAVVGWVYDVDNPIGDNYVDFGLCNIDDNVEENSDAILLDFNVDGCILSYVD